MANKALLIDTSILIDYFRKTDKANAQLVRFSEVFPNLAISAISEFEIYYGATAD